MSHAESMEGLIAWTGLSKDWHYMDIMVNMSVKMTCVHLENET